MSQEQSVEPRGNRVMADVGDTLDEIDIYAGPVRFVLSNEEAKQVLAALTQEQAYEPPTTEYDRSNDFDFRCCYGDAEFYAEFLADWDQEDECEEEALCRLHIGLASIELAPPEAERLTEELKNMISENLDLLGETWEEGQELESQPVASQQQLKEWVDGRPIICQTPLPKTLLVDGRREFSLRDGVPYVHQKGVRAYIRNRLTNYRTLVHEGEKKWNPHTVRELLCKRFDPVIEKALLEWNDSDPSKPLLDVPSVGPDDWRPAQDDPFDRQEQRLRWVKSRIRGLLDAFGLDLEERDYVLKLLKEEHEQQLAQERWQKQEAEKLAKREAA